jgi:hypothetical protein
VSSSFFIVLAAFVVATAIAVIRRSSGSGLAASSDDDGHDSSRTDASQLHDHLVPGVDRLVEDDPGLTCQEPRRSLRTSP